jgi:hypothetical protein
MFSNCTSLTQAPELPATELTDWCYGDMFGECTKLNYIKCLATDISASYCTSSWVRGVSSTGTFVKHPDMTGWSRGSSGIPTGWTIKNVEIPYVTFKAEEDNSSIGLKILSTNQTLEYSTDTTTWNTFDTTTNISLNNGDKVYVRGMLSSDNDDEENYTQFKMTGKIAASGNCNAIWNCEDLNTPLKKYCGYYMFAGCTSLVTAPELPATTLARSCYSWMFYNCTSLTTAPVLSATTLADSCYSYMFQNCTSLVTAPELPATELAPYCYYRMFCACTSLTIAPELPATELAEGCYRQMFYDCTSLTTAPELPATMLAKECYRNMFYNTSLTTAPELPATTLAAYCYEFMFCNCTSLNHITCLATDISASYCTSNWVENVPSTGTFVKHPDMNDWPTGKSGIPEGWAVEHVTTSINPH